MRDGKPTAPPRTLRPAHQVRPGGRWALPSGKQQQPNNIDMVVTGLYLHSSTLDIYAIMFTENMLLALAGKVLLEKNIMEVILASSCRGLQCHYGSIHCIKNLKNYTK